MAQQGQILLRGTNWYVRFYETVNGPDGKPVRRRVFKQLAPYCDKYRTKKSVEPLASEIIAPVNQQTRPETIITLSSYIDNVYMPAVKATSRPSTYNAYGISWRLLKPHVGHLSCAK
jgi:hypothetical protein